MSSFSSVIHSIMNATTNESRAALTQQLKALQMEDAAGFSIFALSQCVDAPDGPFAQFCGIAFKNLIAEDGRTVTDAILRNARAPLLHLIERSVREKPLPNALLLPLLIGSGSLLSLEYCRSRSSNVFDLMEAWITEVDASYSGESWHLAQPLALLHYTLKAASSRPLHAGAFGPLLLRFAPLCWSIMQRTSGARGASETWHAAFCFASKCALRCACGPDLPTQLVFGCTEMALEYCSIAANGSTLTERNQVELCRVSKVVTQTVQKKAHTLSLLGLDFASTSMLSLFVSALGLPVGSNIPEKFAARALSALRCILDLCESDDFCSRAVSVFFGPATTVERFVHELVSRFLSDAELSMEEWHMDPERCVLAATDSDPDTENLVHCAEQVFVSFLAAGQSAVLQNVWDVLSGMLRAEDETAAIGAIHAMGIGYDYLAAGQGPLFTEFLRTKLLPVAKGEWGTPKLRRRAIWMMGMWCFNVPPAARHLVFTALGEIVASTADQVIVMTVWRSFENYVSDNDFSVDQLGESLPRILESLRSTMPSLRDPDMIRFVAQLLDVVMAKTDSTMINNDAILMLLAPILQHMAHSTIEDDDRSVAACASELFTTCARAVLRVSDIGAAWVALFDLSRYTINPDHALCTMADVEAWTTLFALVRCTAAPLSKQLYSYCMSLLDICIANFERDFESLPTCLRIVAALILLLVTDAHGIDDVTLSRCLPIALLTECNNDDVAMGLVCIAEASILASPSFAAAQWFDPAVDAAARRLGETVAFNAAVGILSRCCLVNVNLWATRAVDFPHLVAAVADGYDSMTDEYQRRLIVHATIAGVHFFYSNTSVDEGVAETLSLARQTWESESLQESHFASQGDCYAAMWGDDGVATAHQARLFSVAAADTCWTLPEP